MDTPISYARSIAYLGDASKIRARTCDMFGRQIPLATCQRLVDERQARFDHFRRTSKRASALKSQG